MPAFQLQRGSTTITCMKLHVTKSRVETSTLNACGIWHVAYGR